MSEPSLTPECLEQLHTWVMAHCPCALEEPNFMRGFVVIIEDEISRAIHAERQHLLRKLSEPTHQ
jgi:hypothetical protein